MEFLGELLGLGASGGLFGLLGAITGQVSKHFQAKQKHRFEIEKWNREERLLHLQIQVKTAETENELAIVNSSGSWDGLRASYQHSVDQPSYKWVAAVKSLFRPTLTLLLWLLAAWVFYKVIVEWPEIFDEVNKYDLIIYMVNTIFFCASTATVWWFGDRALTPMEFKNR